MSDEQRIRGSSAPLPVQRRRGITKRHRDQFLERLAAGWSVTHAAKAVGKTRQRFYELADRDPAFAEVMHDAIESGTEVLIDEARRRAVDGWEEEVYQGGELVGYVRRYDSKLLTFLIGARRPEYRQGANGGETGPVTLVIQTAFPGIRPAGDVVTLEADEVHELPAGGDES